MLDAASSASFQRSLTETQGFRDISASLVHGGALQVHASLPPVRGAPSRLLRLQPPNEKSGLQTPSWVTPRARSPSSDKRAGRRLPPALRDRVARTPRLSQDLKEECLERLDKIRDMIPPEALRRPSWIHDKEKDPDLSPMSQTGRRAQQQAAREALGAASSVGAGGSPSSSHHGSAASSPTGGAPLAAPVSPTLSSQGPSTAVEASMAAATAAVTEDAPLRGLGPPRRQRVPRVPPDVTAATGGAHSVPRPQRPAPRETLSSWAQDSPIFNPIVWPGSWRCTAKATDPKPRLRRPEWQNDLPQAVMEVQPFAASRSVSAPILTPAINAPPPAQVNEARRAVAAARDALAWLGQSPDGGAEVPTLPVRGTGSLLRTSLRYVLQT